MSAFVVGKDTIDRVVYLITEARDRRDDRKPFGGDEFDGIPIDPGGMYDEDFQSAIGLKLWQLNVKAVEERYPDTKVSRERPGPVDLTDEAMVTYKYKAPTVAGQFIIGAEMKPASPTHPALYKSLQCLMYQCSEGDIMETTTFKEMIRVANEVAHSIAQKHADYSKAEWA